jgi:hypothetical protein
MVGLIARFADRANPGDMNWIKKPIETFAWRRLMRPVDI